MDCVSLYTEHVPSSWPGTDNDSTVKMQLVTKESVEQYWVDDHIFVTRGLHHLFPLIFPNR
eukprot:scaffold57743_cov50-Cyclotella_meneghiniana.AAC.4